MLNCGPAKALTLIAGALALLSVASAAPVKADLYGLVIGINTYEHEPPLEGAVADARDITDALRELSPNQVVTLTNADATRARITREWKRLIGLARAGDTIVLTYAGHGSQEPDQPPLDEADGLDESFLLGAFNRDAKAQDRQEERLLDDTFHEWFLAAQEKNVRVIFVADACHSGSMTRAMMGPNQPAQRSVPAYGLGEMPDLEGPSDPSILTTEEVPENVIFFSATQEDRTAPEVTIKGKRRGALSYAFARALEGAADRNGDRTLTWLEIKPFIARTVRQLSEAQHYPNTVYRGEQSSDPILSGLPGKSQSAKAEATAITLSIVNLPLEKQAALEPHLQDVSLVGGQQAAELTWDAKARTVFNDVGDPVALDIGMSGLQDVIDKWRALPAIKERVFEQPLDISLDPSDERHLKDASVVFSTEPIAYPYVTAFNLASDGRLQFLYPMPGPVYGDSKTWTEGTSWQLPLKVIGPFGADHLIVIASETALDALHTRLRGAHAASLPQLLDEALFDVDHQIGIHGLYTSANKR